MLHRIPTLLFYVFTFIGTVYCETNVGLDENHRLFSGDLPKNEVADAFLEWSRSQLQTSTWPLDHGDSARSKFVMDAGLPADVKQEDIQVQINTDFKAIQWLYTGGKNSEWIYAMSGDSSTGFKVSKLNATTLEIVQRYPLQPASYTGGMVIHRNGHVYAIHTNVLYAFWNGDLSNVTWVRLPTELNGHLTMTNGMIVTHDGYLLIKQWSLQLKDLALYTGGKRALIYAQYGIVAITILVLAYFFNRRFFKKSNAIIKAGVNGGLSVVIGYYLGNTIALAGMLTLFTVLVGPFNWVRFVTDSWASPNFGGGELKLVDPLTLEVKVQSQLPERCAFARMALSTIKNPEDGVIEDAIVLLGDENVHQFRWRPSVNTLYWVKPWSREYRRNGDGTFPGTGPSIYDGLTYFTDNTFPVAGLADNTYKFFAASIHRIPPTIPTKAENKQKIDYRTAGRLITKKDYLRSNDIPAVPSWGNPQHFGQTNRHPLLPYDNILPPRPNQQAGFMFWSTAINPPYEDHDGQVIVWDSSRSVVQGRNLYDPTEIRWQLARVTQGDCISVIPDRHHIYMTDYGAKKPAHVSKWLGAIAGDFPELKTNDKFFLISDTRTGQIFANVTLPELGTNPTLIVPGKNNDVFLGAQRGLVRVYAVPKK
eukprot:gene12541-13727_t